MTAALLIIAVILALAVIEAARTPRHGTQPTATQIKYTLKSK
jgi:hypothetical protein